jgi:uncharacterized protein YllA (UPF0747 family)
VTLVEGKIAKVLAKLALEPEALARPTHALAGELAREQLPDGVQRALGELRDALERGTGALADAARGIDPTLQGPVQRVKTVAIDTLGEAERKILQAVKRQSETHLQQLEKARLHLYPGGEPQERVVNALYYLARYGPELLDELLARFARSLAPAGAAASVAPPGGGG